MLDERIPFTSMAALLREEFLTGRESLVVAGTHGKTTTTSMLAWIYQVAARENPALEPSFLIGGVAENFGTSFQLRPTRTFIVEGDEYDTAFFDKGPKFLHYFPDALILTHVEFDHADIYADLEAVKTAFKRLVNLVPRRGLIVAYDGSDNVTECVSPRFLPRRALRLQPKPPTGASAICATKTASRAGRFGATGALWAELEMRLAGEHNALNATAAAALAAGQGIEQRGDRRGAGHASRASSAALKCAPRSAASPSSKTSPTTPRPSAKPCARCAPFIRKRACGRCWSRARTRCAARCSKPISSRACASPTASSWPASISSSAFPTPSACIPKRWSARSTQPERQAELLPGCRRHRRRASRRSSQSGDVVAILSNGGFDGIYEKLPARLSERFTAASTERRA